MECPDIFYGLNLKSLGPAYQVLVFVVDNLAKLSATKQDTIQDKGVFNYFEPSIVRELKS